jgi:predicted O-linked N-acetylglucosamine transferase (SPINDLY family)
MTIVSTDRDMARAVSLAQAGKLRQAIAIMDKVVTKNPAVTAARYNLALMLLQSGRYGEALPHLDRIPPRDPIHGAARFSKAKALLALDRPGEALPLLAELAGGGDAEVLLALGNAYRRLGRLEEAAGTGAHLTATHPGFIAGQINYCQLLVGLSPERALPALERAVALHPKSGELAGMIGHCLLRLGRPLDALPHLQRAVAIAPSLTAPKGHLLRAYRELADWDAEDALFAALKADLPHFAAPPLRSEPERQLFLATQDAIFYPFDGAEIRLVAEAEARFRVGDKIRPVPRSPGRAGPLIVGYLSPDFREHATMHLAGDVFGHHDRDRITPIAYSVGPDDGSDWRARMAGSCHAFVDLEGTTDAEAARRIAADGVHILVDMSVYTRHARPGIAARRPAPVQAAWLGLAATSGAPWLDYALVDRVLVPIDHRAHFSERLVFLPDGYQPNLAWTAPPPPPSRHDLGLPEAGTVYCSFNGHRKLDRASFHLWLDILREVAEAVLWMLAPPAPAMQRLREAAGAAGIDPDRLLWAPHLPRPEHLARLPAADLFLDALVCGAHTTAADALRLGLPLLTVAGNRLASRVAASLLTVIGLPELIAPTPAAMRDRAIALGRDVTARQTLRDRLSAALPTSPVFDPARFAASLETAYDAMWQRHAAGKKPSDIDLSLQSGRDLQ